MHTLKNILTALVFLVLLLCSVFVCFFLLNFGPAFVNRLFAP